MLHGQHRYARTLTHVALVCALSALGISAARASPTNAPTLHGFCNTANPCTDNHVNTPTSVDPPDFGFSAGGHDETGVVSIDILAPDNLPVPASFLISGPFLGVSTFTASLFSSTPWTSGDLDTYLGISAQPTNPIGGFLPATLPFQPSADGFFVFQANLGTRTLPSNSHAANADLMTTGGLAAGSYIVAFINQSGNYGATANSGAILETGSVTHRSVPEPATWALMIAGFGLAGATLRWRRATSASA
jgi:hypothetical protein